MMNARQLMLIGALATLLSPITHARAMPILDQSNSGVVTAGGAIGGSPGSFGDPTVAQSFTVGVTGTLASVEVLLDRQNTSVSSISLVAEIYPIVAGLPGGSPLASVTIPNASVPPSLSFFDFDFSAFNIALSVGQQLAIVLHDDNQADKDVIYNWAGSNTNTYPGGALFFDIGGGFIDRGGDSYFKTFVTTPASVPEPATLSLLGLGLAGLIGRAIAKRCLA